MDALQHDEGVGTVVVSDDSHMFPVIDVGRWTLRAVGRARMLLKG